MNDEKPSSEIKNSASEVETLGPVDRTKRKKPYLVVFLALVIAGLLLGIIILANQLNAEKQYSSGLYNDLQAQGKNDGQSAVKTENEDAQPAKAVVVFVPAGVFTDSEKAELKKKLTDPLIAYEKNVVAVTIEVNTPDKFVAGNSDDKYLVSYIREDGVNGGFLFGSKKSGIDYWIPECLDTCQFSDEFKKNFPEVVEKARKTN